MPQAFLQGRNLKKAERLGKIWRPPLIKPAVPVEKNYAQRKFDKKGNPALLREAVRRPFPKNPCGSRPYWEHDRLETRLYWYINRGRRDCSLEQKKKRENIAAGIVGAFLGTLLGVVCIVIIDQMGYVASVSGFVMAICALKGYELLGGTLSKKGAVISSVLVLAMTYLAHRLTWAIAIASSLETGILEAYRAIPYLLEADMLEGPSYWGGLVMLYLFTLLGAVPTIISGLRSADMPDLPAAQAIPLQTEEDADPQALEIYPADMSWLKPLRISASLSLLPGCIAGVALLFASIRQGAPIRLSAAALGAIFGSLLMMFVVMPLIQLCNNAMFPMVRAGGTLWRVNLSALNGADTYRFSKKNGNLRTLQWGKLEPEEQERAKASIQRAIALLSSGQVMHGSALSLAVLPLTNLRPIKETKWAWKAVYSSGGGKEKKISIPKAYPRLSPAQGLEPAREPAPARWPLCLLSLLLAGLIGAAGYGLGVLAENAIAGGSSSPGKTSPGAASSSVPAIQTPSSVKVYETGGVLYQMDSAFDVTSVNAFYDPAGDISYEITVETSDEEGAVDRLLQPINDYRMSPDYDYFRFANAGAEETLVPLVAVDGTEYRYEILSLYLKTGEAVHIGAALAEDGLLTVVEARQGAGGDEEAARGTILYVLKTLRRTETAINEDNYRTLFHAAEELDYGYIAVGYIKAPFEMFGRDAFVDAYVPFSEAPSYSEDGRTIRSAAHGMEVSVTISGPQADARAAVDAAYDAMKASGADIENASETTWFEEYDIAVKQVTYYEENRSKARLAILYADYKQEGYYLSAQIIYLPELMDEDYPELLAELSSVYALTLPEVEPSEGL